MCKNERHDAVGLGIQGGLFIAAAAGIPNGNPIFHSTSSVHTAGNLGARRMQVPWNAARPQKYNKLWGDFPNMRAMPGPMSDEPMQPLCLIH